MDFTKTQILERRFLRLAQLIHDHWAEGSGMNTDLFKEPLIHDSFVIRAVSIAPGATYSEHVVPRVFLRDQCMSMYSTGATVEAVSKILMRYLWIAKITPEEADRINHQLGYKTTMPPGWVLGKDDALARLHEAGINLQPSPGAVFSY